jgi:hypothetical protein
LLVRLQPQLSASAPHFSAVLKRKQGKHEAGWKASAAEESEKTISLVVVGQGNVKAGAFM